MQNGKGDCPRPFSVSRETFIENWNRAFGREKMNTRFSQAEIAIVSQAIKDNPNKGHRTIARELLNSKRLPGRTFYSIYSRVRELGAKPATPAK